MKGWAVRIIFFVMVAHGGGVEVSHPAAGQSLAGESLRRSGVTTSSCHSRL